jgi:hypothetical protein
MDDPAIALLSQPPHQASNLPGAHPEVPGRFADLLLPPNYRVQLFQPVAIPLIQRQNVLPSHVPSVQLRDISTLLG